MQPTLLDYYKEHLELQPSLFRESDNLNLVIQSIFSAIDNQVRIEYLLTSMIMYILVLTRLIEVKPLVLH